MQRLLLTCLSLGLAACQAPAIDAVDDLLAPGAGVEELAGGMGFTEGPVWLPLEGKLVFSDIPAGKLMQWSAEDGLGVFRQSPNPNGNLLDREGRLLTCRHGARDLVRTELDGSLTVLSERFEGRRFNSPNDVAVASDGSLWFTDPPWGLERQREGRELPGNWVYRLEPETGALRVVLDDRCMPNGLAFSPDGSTLYVADTGGHRSHPDPATHAMPATVSAHALGADGSLDTEPLWSVELRCDGMCVDSLGNIYTTTGAGITVLTPDGELLGSIPVPEQPANCCFGGEDFQTLFITARTSLYSVDLSVRGDRFDAP